MDTRQVTLVSVKSMLVHMHQRAMDRYRDEVMDYLTPKKLNQLVEVYLSDEIAYRMSWAVHDDTMLEECIDDVFGRAPWHKGDTSLFEDISAHVYEPLRVMLYRLLDEHGINDQTMNVWHIEARPRNEYLFICKGDYRIHVWNRLAKDYRRTTGIQWGFDQGLYGFRVAEAWVLPGIGGAMGLDHPGDN